MRVVVADDSLLTRAGIVAILREVGCEIVAEARDGVEALAAVRVHRPDVAVLDIRMPPTHTDEGLVAALEIQADVPGTAVLVLSQYVESAYAMRLIETYPGGLGYLLKERVLDAAVLLDALRRLVDGECVIDPTIVAQFMHPRREPDPLDVPDGPGVPSWPDRPSGPSGPVVPGRPARSPAVPAVRPMLRSSTP